MKLAIVGKSCSGKSTIAKKLSDHGLKVAITYTTRPKRDYEVDGVDYHFVTENQFIDMDDRGHIIESKRFNTWWYGMGLGEFNTSDVFIITPSAVEEYRDICKSRNEKILVLYIDADAKLRIGRNKGRNDTDDTNRRFVADELDFNDYNDWDVRLTIKDNESVENLIGLIERLIEKN